MALQHRAVSWYHHYLQYPRHTRLEETLRAAMYWNGMRNTIRKYVKNCRAYQVNKRHMHKYGKLPVIDVMCLTMIDPATSWFEMVELTVITEVIIPPDTKGRKGKRTCKEPKLAYFDKSSAMISNSVNNSWFSRYPRCQYIIYDNGCEFKLHFKALCKSFGITSKPTSIKNPTVNAILEQVHQVISSMLCTAEIDMAPSVKPSNINTFETNAAWAICSTYHTALEASPSAAIFGRDMLFDIPFLADLTKIEE